MNLWWLLWLFLGTFTGLCLFFWISGRRYDRKSEKAKEQIIGEIQAFEDESREGCRKILGDDLYEKILKDLFV